MIKGLIGEKLGHSYSKVIHERIADYAYELIPLNREEFKLFMTKKEFDAINVTIPYKEQVIGYLDELDDSAAKVRAVNTIVNKDGRLIGYNTDTFGFDYTLRSCGIDVRGKKVVVLGNGGASKAICSVLIDHKVSEIIKVKKNPSPETIFYEECYKLHSDASLIINTSPVGMFPNNDDCPIELNRFTQLEAVVDIIYNPLKTKLLIEAEKNGIKAVSGLKMLVAQAVKVVEYFLDKRVDEAVIEEITDEILREKRNIVLIGMPSSGKTTIAAMLAEKLHRESADMDDEILKRIDQKTISDYFKAYGEDSFRQIESEVAADLAKRNGLILATGGGVIKKEVNMDRLRQNGIVLFIERDTDKLISDSTRPLSSSAQAIAELYKERIVLYRKYADFTVDNNGSLQKTIEMILNDITEKRREKQ